MSYSKNPNLPKVRAEAVKMVRAGHSTRTVARHFGFAQGTIVKCCARVPEHTYQYRSIPTESSRPHHHPRELSDEVVTAILRYREQTKRGSEFIQPFDTMLLSPHPFRVKVRCCFNSVSVGVPFGMGEKASSAH